MSKLMPPTPAAPEQAHDGNASAHPLLIDTPPDLLQNASMAKNGKVELLAAETFGTLSLQDKNTYLQNVSRLIAELQGKDTVEPLDKDALARIRRFYMRRKSSELSLKTVKNPKMHAMLKSMADAVHLGEVRRVISHETRDMGTFREPPPDDAQLMFFVPPVLDAPLKDDMNLMDVAPFSLSKNVRKGIIHYKLKDALITIEGGAQTGLVNCYDYDIFINMVTSLAMAMRDYRVELKRGLRPSLPPRIYRPKAADIITFCRRELGGKQYVQLEASLDRLQATRYKITNLTHNNTRRAAESFPLIGRYKVVSRTKNNRIDEVEIEIPDWVYEGVVTLDEAPSILTLHPDYFLISRPLSRFLYRLARKACGKTGFAEYSLSLLHHRSGSMLPFPKFRKMLQDIEKESRDQPLPEYNIAIIPGKTGDKLRMTERKKELPPPPEQGEDERKAA